MRECKREKGEATQVRGYENESEQRSGQVEGSRPMRRVASVREKAEDVVSKEIVIHLQLYGGEYCNLGFYFSLHYFCVW